MWMCLCVVLFTHMIWIIICSLCHTLQVNISDSWHGDHRQQEIYGRAVLVSFKSHEGEQFCLDANSSINVSQCVWVYHKHFIKCLMEIFSATVLKIASKSVCVCSIRKPSVHRCIMGAGVCSVGFGHQAGGAMRPQKRNENPIQTGRVVQMWSLSGCRTKLYLSFILFRIVYLVDSFAEQKCFIPIYIHITSHNGNTCYENIWFQLLILSKFY